MTCFDLFWYVVIPVFVSNFAPASLHLLKCSWTHTLVVVVVVIIIIIIIIIIIKGVHIYKSDILVVTVYYHLLLFCVCIESVFSFKTYWLIDYIMSVSHKLFCCEKNVWAEHDRDK